MSEHNLIKKKTRNETKGKEKDRKKKGRKKNPMQQYWTLEYLKKNKMLKMQGKKKVERKKKKEEYIIGSNQRKYEGAYETERQ